MHQTALMFTANKLIEQGSYYDVISRVQMKPWNIYGGGII